MRFIELIKSWWKRHFQYEMSANVFDHSEPEYNDSDRWLSGGPKAGHSARCVIAEEMRDSGVIFKTLEVGEWRSIVKEPPQDGQRIIYDGKDNCGLYRYHSNTVILKVDDIVPCTMPTVSLIGHCGREYQSRGRINNPKGFWKPFE